MYFVNPDKISIENPSNITCETYFNHGAGTSWSSQRVTSLRSAMINPNPSQGYYQVPPSGKLIR